MDQKKSRKTKIELKIIYKQFAEIMSLKNIIKQ